MFNFHHQLVGELFAQWFNCVSYDLDLSLPPQPIIDCPWTDGSLWADVMAKTTDVRTIASGWLYHVVLPVVLKDPQAWGPAPADLYTDIWMYHSSVAKMSTQAYEALRLIRPTTVQEAVHVSAHWNCVRELFAVWCNTPSVYANVPPSQMTKMKAYFANRPAQYLYFFMAAPIGQAAVTRAAAQGRVSENALHAAVWLADVARHWVADSMLVSELPYKLCEAAEVARVLLHFD